MADLTEQILNQVETYQVIPTTRLLISELKTQRDKDILFAFYVEDRSKESICKEFELSKVGFDRLLSRAKRRLKELIKLKDSKL